MAAKKHEATEMHDRGTLCCFHKPGLLPWKEENLIAADRLRNLESKQPHTGSFGKVKLAENAKTCRG
jgi:hypothetical protein